MPSLDGVDFCGPRDRVDRMIVLSPLQVCAVHTLQALVRSTALGVAVLQFAPDVVMLSLTLLSSACWAMRNAALQLYSKTPAHLAFQY